MPHANFADINFAILAEQLTVGKKFVHKVLDLQKIKAVSFYDFSVGLIILEKIGFFIKIGQKCQFRSFQIDILVSIMRNIGLAM